MLSSDTQTFNIVVAGKKATVVLKHLHSGWAVEVIQLPGEKARRDAGHIFSDREKALDWVRGQLHKG